LPDFMPESSRCWVAAPPAPEGALCCGTRAALVHSATGALRIRKTRAGDQRRSRDGNQKTVGHTCLSSTFIARADNDVRTPMFRNNGGSCGFLW
jgi:hypothetical protein